ncbi:MAG: C-GCAxxG-C-C family protein [Bacteroidota bacterium]
MHKYTSHKKCSGNYTRRSFIKSSFGSVSVLLLPGTLLPAFKSVQNKESEEEIYKQLDELVDKYYPIYGTCSQTSFHVLNEVFGLNSENIIKGLVSFPGIGLRGETCGAVSGSLLAIGLAYEEQQFDEERKRLSREPSFKFCSEFEKEYGSTRCRDVIEKVTGKKYTVTKHEDYEAMHAEGIFKLCPIVIKAAVKLAADIIWGKS